MNDQTKSMQMFFVYGELKELKKKQILSIRIEQIAMDEIVTLKESNQEFHIPYYRVNISE